MGLLGWIFYVFISVVLFIVLKFIQNKFNITKLEKLIISLIALMIISGICFEWGIKYTENIFLIFVFLLIVDVIYTSYFVERDFFVIEENNILYYVILIILGFFINQEFINEVNQVFLTGNDLRLLLWTLSFIFIYKMCKDRNLFSKVSVDEKSFMSRNTILVNYTKFKDKYYDECNSTNKDISNIVYSIMIFENHRRGKVLRNYDYFMFRVNGKKNKLGIMQVESNKFISDIESIEIVLRKIEKLYAKNKKNKKKIDIKSIIKEYDKENYEDIVYIFDIIKKF